jgi:hypothetical protein
MAKKQQFVTLKQFTIGMDVVTKQMGEISHKLNELSNNDNINPHIMDEKIVLALDSRDKKNAYSEDTKKSLNIQIVTLAFTLLAGLFGGIWTHNKSEIYVSKLETQIKMQENKIAQDEFNKNQSVEVALLKLRVDDNAKLVHWYRERLKDEHIQKGNK